MNPNTGQEFNDVGIIGYSAIIIPNSGQKIFKCRDHLFWGRSHNQYSESGLRIRFQERATMYWEEVASGDYVMEGEKGIGISGPGILRPD